MKYFKMVGEIHNIVGKAEHLEEAIKNGIKMMAKDSGSDAVILWYASEKGDFRPYYWIGDHDFTAAKQTEPALQQAYKDQKAVRMLDAKGQSFEGQALSSVFYIPFSSGIMHYGCLQFVKFDGSGQFDEEMADVCEIMVMMFVMALEEKEDFDFGKAWHFDRILLSARNVHKYFKNGENMLHVLKGVNLDVYEGEMLAVLGESGCGKSTFLNIIGGMDTADEGSVKFMGKEMFGQTTNDMTEYRRSNIGFVFQSYNLMPNLTALENLQLIAELVESPMDCKKALEMVGLGDKMDKYPGQLSGGQQQRVSIARALVKNPKIIFADEPTAALDYATSIEVLSVFEEIIKKGTTIVMVTHNEEITRMAHRVVRFRDGKTYEITINKRPAEAKELIW